MVGRRCSITHLYELHGAYFFPRLVHDLHSVPTIGKCLHMESVDIVQEWSIVAHDVVLQV